MTMTELELQQLVLQLAAWTLAYLALARSLRRFSPTVQLHSVAHCFLASALAGVVFHSVTPGYSMFGLDAYRTILLIKDGDRVLTRRVAMHSAGYFAADTADIYLDRTPSGRKRRMYVPHHLASLAGLATVLFGCQVPLWGLWLLECGGAVHHVKFAARIWRWSAAATVLAETLYHTVYVWSRSLLFLNTSRAWLFLAQSSSPALDSICFLVVYALVGMNSVWWYRNALSSWRATSTATCTGEKGRGGGGSRVEEPCAGEALVRKSLKPSVPEPADSSTSN